MLSKKERKILKDISKKYNHLLDLLLEKNTLKQELDKKELKGKKFKRKIELPKEINQVTAELSLYFKDFSNDYKRVFKHRIKKKANLMLDDLILLCNVCMILGLFDEKMAIYRLLPFGNKFEENLKNNKQDLFKVDFFNRTISDLITDKILVDFKSN
ncbi:MAG: hypothetical protein MUO82_08090 [Candidatus Thermoplasmatota archaeon]|nr:hypothetical protein [Candidatus Thermoplasmatota archaeon]